jgi:hypothetical protein
MKASFLLAVESAFGFLERPTFAVMQTDGDEISEETQASLKRLVFNMVPDAKRGQRYRLNLEIEQVVTNKPATAAPPAGTTEGEVAK